MVTEVLARLVAFGVPLVPSPSQLRLLRTSAPELLYTGPKGAGKSTAVLMAAVA